MYVSLFGHLIINNIERNGIMKRQLTLWAILISAVFLFSGCSSMMKSDDTSNGEGASVSDSGSGAGASTSGAGRAGAWAGNPLENPDSPLYSKTIYFEFDRSDLSPASAATLRAHAEYILSSSSSITVEGHADERGSREYNVALGERRAMTIKRFLEAEGVTSSSINTISYGEERPADPSHGEAAWSMNRRGVLVY